MACFVVPTVEAIMVTAAAHALKKQQETGAQAVVAAPAHHGISMARKLHWLSNLLWGGSFLLAFEHLWHGEITPWFPFLSAAGNAADTAVMLQEMATVGVSMALLVTAVWAVGCLVADSIVKKADRAAAAKV